MLRYDRTCEECGDTYKGDARYKFCMKCSPLKAERSKHKGRPPSTGQTTFNKQCTKCSAEFVVSGPGSGLRKHCDDCRQKAMELGKAQVAEFNKRKAEYHAEQRRLDPEFLPNPNEVIAGRVYEGNCRECGTYWAVKGFGGRKRKFCLECRPTVNTVKVDPNDRPKRYCQYEKCAKQIPADRRYNAMYCCKAHNQAASTLRSKTRKAIADNAIATTSMFRNPENKRIPQERQGHTFNLIKANPLTTEMLLSGEVTASAVAVQMGVSTAAVTRAMHGLLAERAMDNERAKWSRSNRTCAMLPVEKLERARALGLSGRDDTKEYKKLVEQLVRAYSVFSRRHFNLEGRRPLIKGFHRRWIRSIIEAYCTGGKQLILSPPRHGKSETLIRFVVWLIVMEPNIRIGWFCASRDVAELMLGSVKDILENNEQLIKDTLPSGELYNPGLKSSKPWSRKEIKVAQQSHVGAKSSSLLALGRTSKFLSRDMDLIVVDDLEDFDSTREESQRNYSKNKLAEIGTRKTEETAEVYIGSRQHPDDIPNAILSLEGSILQWKVIVDTAHDEDCVLDPDDPDQFAHHQDCMLFPEVRSYRYLMEKKLEMETLGLAHMYPLRYLNTPVPEDGQVFDVKLIRENLDRSRDIGLEQLPPGILIAGLDPSARQTQASFLWHYNHRHLSMVDLETSEAGGIAGAHKIMRRWSDMYEQKMWFYEDNAQQVEFFNDPRTKKLAIELGLTIKPFRTGKNKMDAEMGISSMAPWYHSGRISLPYGTPEARKKVNRLLRQLELWTTDGVVNKKHKTDIKMAMWFPFPYIVKLDKQSKHLTLETTQDSSYPDLDSLGVAPWEQAFYPDRM